MMIFFAVALSLTCGCGETGNKGKTELDEFSVRITPREVFDDSTRILAPHLGRMIYAADIEHCGNGKQLMIGCETWENGKKIKKVNWAERGMNGETKSTLSWSMRRIDETQWEVISSTLGVTATFQTSAYSEK